MAKITLTLDTSNPSKIEVKTDKLQILILGQIDSSNLDSLSVVLKISKLGKQTPPIRQSLDLYREERVEMLIDTICKKLELGFAETQSIVYEFIEQIEAYRFKLIENNKQFESPSNLSSKDKQSAKRYLGKIEVLEFIKSDLQQAGIFSHNNEALLLYLSIASRKLENPLSICFLDDSEVSKKLFDVIKNCTPESEYIYPSSISSQALYYLGLDDFKHKTMFLSEFGSKQDIHAPLAQLIEDKELMKIVALKDKSGMPYTMNPIVQGPINLNTISKYKFKPRINKLPLLTIPVEASEEDINKWMYAKKMESAGMINYSEQTDARNRLMNLQSVLQPIKIINPFAVDIELPDSHKGDSKLLNHLLRLIETITYLNQFQREQYIQDAIGNPTESFIKTEKQDIVLAIELLTPMFEIKPSLLHPKTRDFYVFLKSWLRKHDLEEFKSYQIRQSNPSMVKRSVNRYLKELLENGLLEIVSGTKNTGYIYVLKGLQFNTDIENSFSLNDFVKGIFND